jgi:hypothetical protein
MLQQRNYVLQIHTTKKPASININNTKISIQHWHYSDEKNGLLIVDCGKFDVHKSVEVIIK